MLFQVTILHIIARLKKLSNRLLNSNLSKYFSNYTKQLKKEKIMKIFNKSAEVI